MIHSLRYRSRDAPCELAVSIHDIDVLTRQRNIMRATLISRATGGIRWFDYQLKVQGFGAVIAYFNFK